MSDVALAGSNVYLLNTNGDFLHRFDPEGTGYARNLENISIGPQADTLHGLAFAPDLQTETTTVTITVPGPGSPVAVDDDSYAVDEDEMLVVDAAAGVLANDSDPQVDLITAVVTRQPFHGALNVNPDGSFDYTPDANYVGLDSFQYQASDGLNKSNVATASIAVNPVPDPPTAVNDDYVVDEDETLVATFSHQDTLFISGDAADGAVNHKGDVGGSQAIARVGSGGDAIVNGISAVYFFELPAIEPGGAVVDANLSFNYVGLTDGPEFSADLYGLGWVSGSPILSPSWYSSASLDMRTGNDLGTNLGSNQIVRIQDQILVSTSSGASSNTPAGRVETDAGGDASLSSFIASLYDHGAQAGDFAVLRINPDSNPTVNNVLRGYLVSFTEDPGNGPELSVVVKTPDKSVVANDTDPDGDALTASLVDDVANGMLALSGDGTFTYEPNANFFGSDSFTYMANDGTFDSNIATVNITVQSVNDIPTVVDDDYLRPVGGSLNVLAAEGVLANDSDLETADLTAVLVDAPTQGNLTLNPDGSFEYTPDGPLVFSDSFTYRADDGTDDSDLATVTLTLDVPAIDVGAHLLAPNTPDQTVEIFVVGGQDVSGLNLFAQVGDGGPELADFGLPAGTDGPAFTGVDLKSGTIFAGVPDEPVDQSQIPQVANWFIAIQASGGTVPADGLLATLTVDTTGFFAGTWNLLLKDVLPDLGGFDTDFAGTPANITNGSLQIASAQVVDRHIFYNNSAFDGNDPAASLADLSAIATDKTALLPGRTASFANYTSYSRGINGVMVDVSNLADRGSLTAADFQFRVGNSDNPSNWTAAPAPVSISVQEGGGTSGSDRVTIIWPDGAIQKQWLQVVMKANINTGLLNDDAFYFGNAVGESGNSTGDTLVNATDIIGSRDNPHGPLDQATIADEYDFNRDRLVNATDLILARDNATSPFSALRLFEAPTDPVAGFNGQMQATIDAATGNITIDTGGLTVNGWRIDSVAGIFTGDPADIDEKFPALTTDTDIGISTGFVAFIGVDDLGNVIGSEILGNEAGFFSNDVTGRFTLDSTQGLFDMATLVIPATTILAATTSDMLEPADRPDEQQADGDQQLTVRSAQLAQIEPPAVVGRPSFRAGAKRAVVTVPEPNRPTDGHVQMNNGRRTPGPRRRGQIVGDTLTKEAEALLWNEGFNWKWGEDWNWVGRGKGRS